MFRLMELYNTVVIYGAGLDGLKDKLVQHWIGPIFLFLIAVFAIKAFKDQAMRAFGTLVIVGIIAALLIYAAPVFFGKDGTLTSAAQNQATEVTSGGFGMIYLDYARYWFDTLLVKAQGLF